VKESYEWFGRFGNVAQQRARAPATPLPPPPTPTHPPPRPPISYSLTHTRARGKVINKGQDPHAKYAKGLRAHMQSRQAIEAS